MTAAFPDDMPGPVREGFEAMSSVLHHCLAALRGPIFDVAARDDRSGPMHEAPKRGEPARLPQSTERGSAVRPGVPRDGTDCCALHSICNTSMVDRFRARLPELDCVGNRAVPVDPDAPPPGAIGLCIAAVLSSHPVRAVRA